MHKNVPHSLEFLELNRKKYFFYFKIVEETGGIIGCRRKFCAALILNIFCSCPNISVLYHIEIKDFSFSVLSHFDTRRIEVGRRKFQE